MMTRHSLFALLGLDLPQVELELLALQDVAVGPAALSGPGGDGGEHTAGHELICEPLLHLGVLLPLLVLLLGVLGPLLVEDGLLGVGELGALLATQGQREVRLVPGERVVTRVVEATGSVFFPSSSGGILDRKWKMKNKR